MFMRTKSSIRIMMTIIMKLVPLMPSLYLSTRVLRSIIILSSSQASRQGTEEMKLQSSGFVSCLPRAKEKKKLRV
jgi:hypothetical protein